MTQLIGNARGSTTVQEGRSLHMTLNPTWWAMWCIRAGALGILGGLLPCPAHAEEANCNFEIRWVAETRLHPPGLKVRGNEEYVELTQESVGGAECFERAESDIGYMTVKLCPDPGHCEDRPSRHVGVRIVLTPACAEMLDALAPRNVDRDLAVLFEDEVIGSLVVLGARGQKNTSFSVADVGEEEARLIAGSLNRQCSAPRPSGDGNPEPANSVE